MKPIEALNVCGGEVLIDPAALERHLVRALTGPRFLQCPENASL